jgi:hypothetical protein
MAFQCLIAIESASPVNIAVTRSVSLEFQPEGPGA